ncbi:MAG: hypothetical protein ACRD1Y_12995 [Terriglobales bacterium]
MTGTPERALIAAANSRLGPGKIGVPVMHDESFNVPPSFQADDEPPLAASADEAGMRSDALRSTGGDSTRVLEKPEGYEGPNGHVALVYGANHEPVRRRALGLGEDKRLEGLAKDPAGAASLAGLLRQSGNSELADLIDQALTRPHHRRGIVLALAGDGEDTESANAALSGLYRPLARSVGDARSGAPYRVGSFQDRPGPQPAAGGSRSGGAEATPPGNKDAQTSGAAAGHAYDRTAAGRQVADGKTVCSSP